jgi:hypothetical protein
MNYKYFLNLCLITKNIFVSLIFVHRCCRSVSTGNILLKRKTTMGLLKKEKKEGTLETKVGYSST